MCDHKVTLEQVLSDLEESRSQIINGKGLNMEQALQDLGNRHGFSTSRRSEMDQSNTKVPYYDPEQGVWKVNVGDYTEEGDLLYVACEYCRTSLYYPYNTAQTAGKPWHGHDHSMSGVIHSLLQEPFTFNIDGFEEYYSEQEKELLRMLQDRLKQDLGPEAKDHPIHQTERNDYDGGC